MRRTRRWDCLVIIARSLRPRLRCTVRLRIGLRHRPGQLPHRNGTRSLRSFAGPGSCQPHTRQTRCCCSRRDLRRTLRRKCRTCTAGIALRTRRNLYRSWQGQRTRLLRGCQRCLLRKTFCLEGTCIALSCPGQRGKTGRSDTRFHMCRSFHRCRPVFRIRCRGRCRSLNILTCTSVRRIGHCCIRKPRLVAVCRHRCSGRTCFRMRRSGCHHLARRTWSPTGFRRAVHRGRSRRPRCCRLF